MYIEEKIQQSLLWKILLKIQRYILVFVTIVIVSVLGGVVITRYLLHVNFLGYDEIILVAAYWMYFIGSARASYEESHIAVNIIEQYLSPSTSLKVSIISKIIQFIIGIPLIYLAFEMLHWDIKANPTTSDWEIPLLIPQTAIMLGFILMTFYSFVYILRDYHKLISKNY